MDEAGGTTRSSKAPPRSNDWSSRGPSPAYTSTKGRESDNLIAVSEVSATDAARNFADLLDGVEHRGERFTIVRRGRAIAHLEPVNAGRGVDAKALLRRHKRDSGWGAELVAIRELAELQERP